MNDLRDVENMARGANAPVGLEVEQAIQLLLEHAKPVERVKIVPLLAALGKISGEEVRAPMDNPPFDRSPLDGYAVRAEDVSGASKEHPVTLPVIGFSYAGAPFAGSLPAGTAIRIMTGAVMPAGSDAVIMQEVTDYGETVVEFYGSVAHHQNYCFRGEDIQKDGLLAAKGQKLSYAHLGIMASVGISEVKVREPLRIALICTGDELTPLGEPLAAGKIYNSNQILLQARIRELGFTDLVPVICKDTPEEIARALREARDGADILITTGGVSVGTRDMMHRALDLLGARRLFWKLNMKPGSPILCAEYRGKLIIALSGNPFAALATFELAARPVLAQLSGDISLRPVEKTAVLRGTFPKGGGTRRFVRGYYEDGQVRLQGGNHASGALLLTAGCNCMIDIPKNTGPLLDGAEIRVVLI